MLHPNTVLKHINNKIGYGVFATQFIPKGTITYAKDELEIELDDIAFQKLSPPMQEQAEKYSYRDARGIYILSWDLGKYVNHCCFPNTLSTGYGFEVAIQDIHSGQEITDDYGLFNLEKPFPVTCEKKDCRGCISAEDLDTYASVWDKEIEKVLSCLFKVEQPLFTFLSNEVKNQLEQFRQNPAQMLSVSDLKFKK